MRSVSYTHLDVYKRQVLESTGMMRVIDQSGDDLPMFSALRQLFDPERLSLIHI